MAKARIRFTTALLGAVALLAFLNVPRARAAVPESNITAPASPTYLFSDSSQPPGKLSVTGDASGSGTLTIACYHGTSEPSVLDEGIEAEEGKSFTVEVPISGFPEAPCVLRAVPAGSVSHNHEPGSPDPYSGPTVTRSKLERKIEGATQLPYNFALGQVGLAGYLDLSSAGECGLSQSWLFDPLSLLTGGTLWDCDAALFGEAPAAALLNGAGPRSSIRVDGHNAFDAYAAHDLYDSLKPSTPPPALSLATSFNPVTGATTVTETDTLVECSGNVVAFPETSESCSSFVPAGVALQRTWTTAEGGTIAYMTDQWRSTDGAPHTITTLYTQEFAAELLTEGVFWMPGSSGFASTSGGETIALPSGPGEILYREDGLLPEEGNLAHPVAALIYDRPPGEPLRVYAGSAEGLGRNGFAMPYSIALPANGSSTIRMAFAQAQTPTEARTLGARALAAFPPALSISSPAVGAVVSTPTLTVSGQVGDSGQLTSLTVAGHAVAVGAEGAWSTPVALTPGSNEITAQATDQAGLSTQASTSVYYQPATPPSGPPSTPGSSGADHARRVGSLHVGNGKVTLTIACGTTSGGEACRLKGTLAVTELLRKGRLVAIGASGRGRRHTVTIATVNVTIAAGHRRTLTLSLNALGRRLLGRFKHLPVHLSLRQSGAQKALVSAKLTLRQPPRPHTSRH